MAAGPASMETPMEARIARLEADVAHLRTDVADIKVDLRTLRDKMDTRMDRFDVKLDSLKDTMLSGDEALRDSIQGGDAALRNGITALNNEIAAAKVWALLLYFALAAGMLGTMARGFGWV
jgi:hypothetical protein